MTLDVAKSPVAQGELAIVIGAGSSGEAAIKLLIALGAKVRLLERHEKNISDELKTFLQKNSVEVVTGAHQKSHFEGASIVITSPGVPLNAIKSFVHIPFFDKSDRSLPLLIGELELALPFINAPIIAVTGTSGKTTTVSLIGDMLTASGKKVFIGGNIGTPLSAFVLSEKDIDICVLECSSFQLQTSPSIHPKVAILLNLTANHLDQHESMEEYTNAKLCIFANQTSDDLAIIPPDFMATFTERGFTAKSQSFSVTERFANLGLVGKHNIANAEVAYLACEPFGVQEADAKKAIKEFSPLRHRLEVVGTFNGVTFVNDSKSTTVESMHVALESFDAPILLLAGGKFKGGDLASLTSTLTKKVKEVLLFGASREIFEHEWKGIVPLSYYPTMDDVFAVLWKKAEKGDVVLLSPATSSFDLYSNYRERGDHFCRLARVEQ